MADLATVLDKISGIYAPPILDWIDRYKFYGIETIIRAKSPVAWPTQKVPLGYADGYTHEEFEREAASLFESLAEETSATINSCPVLSDIDRPIFIKTHKSCEKNIDVRVSINSHGMNVGQSISALKEQKELFTASSKRFMIILLPELDKKHLDSLAEMLSLNPLLAIKYIQNNKLVLNGLKADPVKWIKHLPELIDACIVSEGDISRLYAKLSGEEFKIMATEKYCQSYSLAVEKLEEAGCGIVKIPDYRLNIEEVKAEP